MSLNVAPPSPAPPAASSASSPLNMLDLMGGPAAPPAGPLGSLGPQLGAALPTGDAWAPTLIAPAPARAVEPAKLGDRTAAPAEGGKADPFASLLSM